MAMRGHSESASSSQSRKRKYIKGLQPLGYAKRLSRYEDKGQCGDDVLEEHEASPSVETKIRQIATAIQQARYVVAHTGAGISTAAGIPDFRGKHGIWTREKRGEPLPDHEKCWNNAVPTLGHMALVGLMRAKKLQAVISQNIDGLHLRSGIPRDKLSELHGNMLMEKCEACTFEVLRSCDVGGIGFRPTGRTCMRPRCSSRLVDALLDWEDELPQPDLSRAEFHAKQCEGKDGLALCLGTSMQMCPARDLPCQAGKMVLVNLQPTVRDEEAWVVVRAKIDDVMWGVMQALKIPIPLYQRCETFKVQYDVYSKHLRAKEAGSHCKVTSTIKAFIGESGFHDIPCGYIATVSLSLKPQARESFTFDHDGPIRLTEQPFEWTWRATATFPPDHCPFCAAKERRSGTHTSTTVDVDVEIDFEPMPPVHAGIATLPSKTPPPWRGSHNLDLSTKAKAVFEHSVVLMEVDYETLYRPPPKEG